MAKDAISALRDILATNWSKPPEPSIEDIAEFFPDIDIKKSRFILPVLLQLGVESLVSGDEKFQKKIEMLNRSQHGKAMADMLSTAMTNNVFKQLVNVIAEYNIEPVEIRPGNVGVVMRDDSPKFVVLDVSTGLYKTDDLSI